MSGFGGVDPNIPLQAGRGVTPPENPLQTAGQFMGLRQLQNQNTLFPGQQQLQQQAIQGGAVDLSKKINQAGYQAMAPLLAMAPGQITHSAFTTALASVENNLGIPTSGILQDIMATTPSGDGPAFDGKVRALIASRSQETGGPAVAQVTPAAGPPITYGGAGTGLPPTIQPTTVNPAGRPNPGVVAGAGQAFPLGLSPGEAATPTPSGVTPSGQTILKPLGSSPFVNGGRNPNIPAALQNPNAPAPDVVTTLGPAGQAQQTAQGGQSQTSFQQISDQGVQARSQGAILDTMLGDTSEFTTGAGAEGIKNFQNTLQRVFGPDQAKAFGIDPASVAAHESFDKFAAQLADAQGAGSDARLAVNQHANPAATNTPAGVDFIIRQLRGNTDYLRAQAQLAATYPDKTDVQGFQANVANNLDPRVFQYARMTPQQKASFYTAMPNKQEFQQAYRFAAGHGLLPPPQGVPAAPATPAPAAQQPPAVPRG